MGETGVKEAGLSIYNYCMHNIYSLYSNKKFKAISKKNYQHLDMKTKTTKSNYISQNGYNAYHL